MGAMTWLASRCTSRLASLRKLWGLLAFLSMWFAQVDAFAIDQCPGPSVTSQSLKGELSPPVFLLRGDQVEGTALDLLNAIADYQLPQPGVYQQEAAAAAQVPPSPEIDAGPELDLLLQYPGPRSMIFYRPNPNNADRVLSLPFAAESTTTIADIRAFILRHWPDLPTSEHWQLMDVDDAWKLSPLAPDHTLGFLVWSSLDLLAPEGSILAIIEFQIWDARTGQMDTQLKPVALWKNSMFTELLEFLQLREHCEESPCTVKQNGFEQPWRRRLVLWDSAYILISAVRNTASLRTIIDAPDGLNAIDSNTVPRWFWEAAETIASAMWPAKTAEITLDAQHLQVSLSLRARSIFMLTGMNRLHAPAVQIWRPAQEDINSYLVLHAARRDPFGLFYDIIAHYDIGMEAGWTLQKVDDSFRRSRSSLDDQVILLLAEQYPPARQVVCMIQVVAILQGLYTETLRIRTLPHDVHGRDLQNYARPLTVLDGCRLQANGRAFSLDAQLNLHAGDFLELRCFDEDDPSRSALHIPVGDENPNPEHPAKKLRPAFSSSETTGTTPYSTPPPPGLDLCLGWFIIVFTNLLARVGYSILWFFAVSSTTSTPPQLYPPPQRSATRQLSWIWRLPCVRAFTVLVCLGLATPSCGLQVHRYGEAAHPGPETLAEYWIGTSNPSGLANKEFIYSRLPAGIWGISETQLSKFGQRRSKAAFKSLSYSTGKNLGCQCGAPVELRARSAEAGTWSGVMLVGEAWFRPVNIPWLGDEHRLGRIQVAEAWIGSFSVLLTNLYGWARSPTWPKAATYNAQMLDQITQEVVLTRGGPRIIQGDFNMQPDEGCHFAIWKQHGWIEIQDWALQMHAKPPVMTSHMGLHAWTMSGFHLSSFHFFVGSLHGTTWLTTPSWVRNLTFPFSPSSSLYGQCQPTFHGTVLIVNDGNNKSFQHSPMQAPLMRTSPTSAKRMKTVLSAMWTRLQGPYHQLALDVDALLCLHRGPLPIPC